MNEETKKQRRETEVAEQIHLLKVSRTSGFTSVEDLKQAMHDLILHKWGWSFHRGVRLYKLNKQFGYSASKLGTSVRNLAEDLVREGKLSVLETPKGIVVAPEPKRMEYLIRLRTPEDPSREDLSRDERRYQYECVMFITEGAFKD